MLIVSALAAGNTLRSPDAPGPAAGGPVMGGPVAGGTVVMSRPVASGSRPAPVQDAHACLWSRVRRSLAGRPAGAMMLARHAEAPATWAAPLTAELRAAGAGENSELVRAAVDLLRMMIQNGLHSAGHGSPAVQA